MSGLGNKEIMAKNIQFYMDSFGVSRNKLSDDLGIKYTTLADWINAKTYPRIDKIEMLANYFGVSKSNLVESSDSNIISIYNKLEAKRKTAVFNFASNQLEEQENKSKITELPRNKNYTLAAHSENPNQTYTDEEIEQTLSALEKIAKKHNVKMHDD